VKNSVQARKSRIITFVSPGVTASGKRYFKQANLIDFVIESRDESGARDGSVFVTLGTDQVKIPSQCPRSRKGRGKIRNGGEEEVRITVIRWSINVSD
jgi:hypothetical protein